MLKRMLRRILPSALLREIEEARERRELAQIQEASSVDATSLLPSSCFDRETVFRDSGIEKAWVRVSDKLAPLDVIVSAGGVNPGDRRALFYLVNYLKPRRLLEIGTHIGASTVYLAGALTSVTNGSCAEQKLVTVDIVDVNDPRGPWFEAGSQSSPKDLLKSQGLESLVEFVSSRSLDYLGQTTETFDLILLDGDHAAATVYQELSAALARLRPGGVIVLHDYFPGGEAIWSNASVKLGPYLAVRRLMMEGVPLSVVPLGELPWSTKLGSTKTSLALVTGAQA